MWGCSSTPTERVFLFSGCPGTHCVEAGIKGMCHHSLAITAIFKLDNFKRRFGKDKHFSSYPTKRANIPHSTWKGNKRSFLKTNQKKTFYYVQLKQSLCFQLRPSPGHSDSLIWCFSSSQLVKAPSVFSVSFSTPKGQYHNEDKAPNVRENTTIVQTNFRLGKLTDFK